MKFRFLSILFIVVFITSCGLFDNGSDKITDNYVVLWIDIPSNQTICKREKSDLLFQIVPEYVFAVGHNKNFIIAKQHPTSGFENGFKVNSKITNFYIIDIKRKFFKTEEGLFGPLTAGQFDSLKIKLNIENIKFDMIYPDNP